MKVTVTKYLNVRIGAPKLTAPCYQYLAPGSELEVEDKINNGDKYDGDERWLKDGAGNYYWVGGTNYDEKKKLAEIEMEVKPDSSYDYWYLKKYGIQELHTKSFNGKGTKICVIDSGLYKSHDGLEYSSIESKSYINENPLNDDYGHGTQSVGVIKANGKRVFGTAFMCDLNIAQVYSYNQSVKIENFINALKDISSSTDVVSISLIIPFTLNDDLKTKIKDAVSKIISAGSVVVVAHGNPNYNSHNWLGSLDSVISVGAVDQSGNYSKWTIGKGQCTIYAPGASIYTTNNDGDYCSVDYTSFATPFVASVCALGKQIRKDYSSEQIKTFLIKSAKILDKKKTLFEIDPRNFINIALKNQTKIIS